VHPTLAGRHNSFTATKNPLKQKQRCSNILGCLRETSAKLVSTSHLRRHPRFSDNDFSFPVPTKTLSYDSCGTITIHHHCLDVLWSLQ